MQLFFSHHFEFLSRGTLITILLSTAKAKSPRATQTALRGDKTFLKARYECRAPSGARRNSIVKVLP